MHKNSFESLISKIKSTESSNKSSARRSIFNDNKDSEASAVDSTNSENIDLQDSDSSLDCPLQMYSSEGPMSFLTVELLTSTSEKNKGDKRAVEREKEESSDDTSSGFLHTEMETAISNSNSRTIVNERSIVSDEVPCSSNNSDDMKMLCVEKRVKRKKCSKQETQETQETQEMQETQKKNDNLTKATLEDNVLSDCSINDSVICNSDFGM